jgi:hypothetical protein
VIPDFRWNEWNVNHIADHGVEPSEAEYVVLNARPPYPEKIGDGKWRVWGQSQYGRYLQVIFLHDPGAETIYIIHARPLTHGETRRRRRRKRRRR